MLLSIKVKRAKYMPGDYSLYLSFAYNERVVHLIKSYPDRAWHKQSKEWEVPLTDLEYILEDFQSQTIEIEGSYIDMTPKKEVTKIDFDFKTEPFSHQKESFLYGMNHDKWFLGDQMGLGKTKQAIDIAVAMKEKRGYKHCLIVCGVNSLKWNWYNEVHTHSYEDSFILGMRKRKRTGENYVSGNKAKLQDLRNLSQGVEFPYFIITNVESLRSKEITSLLNTLVDNDIISMIVVDEFHKMHNVHNSQQGKALLKLQPFYRLAMTGTPMMNNPLELYGILRWLGIEKHSFYQFKKHYAVMGGYGGYEVIGYKHLDDLEDQLDSIMLRRLKEDVLDLPDKVYVDEYVDMLPKQEIIYKEIKADIKMNIDKVEMSANPLAEMIRMRQATGFTGILSNDVKCSAKLDRMVEIVEDVISDGRKLLVFSNWTSIIDEATNRLNQYNPLKITGDTDTDTRQTYVDEFQSNPNVSVMCGTIGAMGTGLTLTEASVVIFLDHPWNGALYEQAIDRCHRIGQKNNITIYNIMCENTIDSKIWKLVQKKTKIADAVVDGVAIETNKDLVQYLLN